MTEEPEPNLWIKRYHSSSSDDSQVDEDHDEQQEQNYDFDYKVHKQILDKLEELSLRIECLEITEGLSILDGDIVSIPFKDLHNPYL
jgi:hypothetical protein